MRGQSLFLLLACSCSSGLSIPADRPVLSWSGSAASDANRSLLHGFAGPDVHSCAQDPTRVYIGELFFYGISDVQVPWHWAPIVSGPFASRPTLSQPEFFLAGASTVQVGTQSFVDPDASGRIVRDLESRLRADGISDVQELIGALRTDLK